MLRFRKIVSYCLIFTLLLNNTLTSVLNKAWASDVVEDINSNQSLRNILMPINEEALNPAAVVKLQQVINEEWEEKYTLKGFSIVRMIWTVLATIIGFIALNAWEPINAKTLFPKLGIPRLGFGTESAFYEATAAIHGVMALGIAAYSYTIFKFGLKLSSPAKAIFSKAKQSCSDCLKKEKNKLSDIEKADNKQSRKEAEPLQPTQNVFRKWTIPKVLCALPLEIINLGSALTYAMIVTSYFRQIEVHFPGFANFSTPFLVASIAVDKLMTGHATVHKTLESIEEKCRGKKTSLSRVQLKNRIRQSLEFVKSLDSETVEGRDKLRELIKRILLENEFLSAFEEESEGTINRQDNIDSESSSSEKGGFIVRNVEENSNPNSKIVPNLDVQNKRNDTEDLIISDTSSEQSSQEENKHKSETVDTSQNHDVTPPSLPINFDEVYKLISQHSLPSAIMDSNTIQYISSAISFLAIWGLSTTMTQGLETILGNPTLATIFGSSSSLWIAFSESQDITKAIERIIVSLLPHKVVQHFLGTKDSIDDNKRNTSQAANKKDKSPLPMVQSLPKFLLNVLGYRGILLILAAWTYTFFELSDYLNEDGESYENNYTKINSQNPTLKYAGFVILYLFENLSNMHLQDRAYENFSRRIKQFIICPTGSPSSNKKKILGIFQERLIGIFEVMLKTVDKLTEEGLEVLEKLIPLNPGKQPNNASAAQDSTPNSDDSSQEDDPKQPLLQN